MIKVMIEGPQGAGKTRVAENFLASCDRMGLPAELIVESGDIHRWNEAGILAKVAKQKMAVRVKIRQAIGE